MAKAKEKRMKDKDTGPVVGRFWRLTEEVTVEEVRPKLHVALKGLPIIGDPNRCGPLIDDLAQIVIDYYCLLRDSLQLPRAQATALAVEEIGAFGDTAKPPESIDEGLPRTGLPLGQSPDRAGAELHSHAFGSDDHGRRGKGG
jgi:hypothetical protein